MPPICWAIALKAGVNICCAVTFAWHGRYPLAVMFAGFVVADFGSLLIARGMS